MDSITEPQLRAFTEGMRQFARALARYPVFRGLAIEVEAAAAHMDSRSLSHEPNWDGLSPELELERPHAWSQRWEWMAPAMYRSVASCRFQSMNQRLPNLVRVARKFDVRVDDLKDTLHRAPNGPGGSWARVLLYALGEG